MPKMSTGDLKALLSAERYDALSAMAASKLSDERSRALDYYMGDMSRDMPAPDGRSTDTWSGDWSTGQTMPAEEFSGLPVADEHFATSSLKFELRREAGTFAFDGAFRDGRGAGLFVFSPRPEYATEMKAIGYADDLPIWRRYQLAIHDVGPKYIRALKSEGYDKLTLDEIQRGRNHGVSLEYIRDMKAQGYKIVGWDTLVKTRDHGVTPEFMQELRGQGLTASTLDGYIRLRDHGVRAADIIELKQNGYDKLTAEELIRLHDHGVKAAMIRELSAQGFKNLPIEDVVRAKDHGVSAEYVSDMKELGLKDLTLPQIVRLRDHGITPGFVNHVRARGFKDTTVDDLVRLKNGGLWRD